MARTKVFVARLISLLERFLAGDKVGVARWEEH